MNSVINTNLTAPGRMDVIEQVLSTDPFFREKMKESDRRRIKNRRGRRKRYSGLTIELVNKLALARLDAITLRRDQIIARAFELCDVEEQLVV
jgi:hypothetical protein